MLSAVGQFILALMPGGTTGIRLGTQGRSPCITWNHTMLVQTWCRAQHSLWDSLGGCQAHACSPCRPRVWWGGLSRRKVMERPSPASPQPVALVAAAQAAAAPSALLSMAEHADLSQRGPAQPLAAGSGAGGTQQPRPLPPAPFSSQHLPSTY